METNHFLPAETTDRILEAGIKKSKYSILHMLLLGILGGAFIAFASEGSNTAIHTIASVGLGKALAGALFSTGLMMVVIAGAELFTGNILMVIPFASKKFRIGRLLRNWVWVYIGNFIGSMIIVLFIIYSGQFGFSGGGLGGFTIKLAAYKTGLTFTNAFFMGILCNWLVCMAVWMAAAAKDITGKLFAIFFPIWLFITSGFEHSVANMYYIPAGILAKANPLFVQKAIELGAKQSAIDHLNWGTLFTGNLIPVTLGNIVGGMVFVGMIFWVTHCRKSKSDIQACDQ
ncbi:MAG: formate/nitrite transporter family protein [Saccharofermentanales bacterium]